MMISVKDAVKAATQFVADMFSAESPQGLRLEEVELSQDERTWNVTLSFVRGATPGAAAALWSGGSVGREYKTVAVRTADGVVTSVKIRQLA
jgi:hypothetical protein